MIAVTEILNILTTKLSKKRIIHSRNVAREAARMARREGQVVQKAVIAGLLHDYARELDISRLRFIARNNSLTIDKYEWQNPILLHGPVGAFLVKKELNIQDKVILEAIRYHTIGFPEMGKLALIIYLADIIEPARNFPGVDEIREDLKKDLKTAVITACDRTLLYNLAKKKIIHPYTLMLRNKLLGGIN